MTAMLIFFVLKCIHKMRSFKFVSFRFTIKINHLDLDKYIAEYSNEMKHEEDSVSYVDSEPDDVAEHLEWLLNNCELLGEERMQDFMILLKNNLIVLSLNGNKIF